MSHLSDHIFNFKTDITNMDIPTNLNNPFETYIPKVATIAAQEFQGYISKASTNWEYSFDNQKGKMFGVLVVQKTDCTYAYLGTVSGKLQGKNENNKFVPAVLNENKNNDLLTLGLTELARINNIIKQTEDQNIISKLKEERKVKSTELQKQLFENTILLNTLEEEQNVIQIFENSNYGYPPAAAGECAAPKLLQFAFRHKLKPVSIAEFWWGLPAKSNERKHKNYYPACKNKCRPILEFMLNDKGLFAQANTKKHKI